MARIKIADIPKEQKVSKEELKRFRGGITLIVISGVDGESTDDSHENWIEILLLASGITLSNSTTYFVAFGT